MNSLHSISIPVGDGLYNFRVAGIAIQNGKLLLHKTEDDNFWSLPGGRCEMFEFSKETLLREILEETGLQVEVQQLAWLVENFFEYKGVRHHELGLYYHMRFLTLKHQNDFVFKDGDNSLLYRWFPIGDVDHIKVYPEFIKSSLLLERREVQHFMVRMQDLHNPNS
jgi:8-oxo-dGTP pyrophosphatase MutT (NUDIX family)